MSYYLWEDLPMTYMLTQLIVYLQGIFEVNTDRRWDSRAVVVSTHCASFPGCTLFFYETDGRSGIDHTSTPKHAVWAENSIAQAVPEHPKKDFVFCLSNSMGDSYLFQVKSYFLDKDSSLMLITNIRTIKDNLSILTSLNSRLPSPSGGHSWKLPLSVPRPHFSIFSSFLCLYLILT